jgi:hypothetical protein
MQLWLPPFIFKWDNLGAFGIVYKGLLEERPNPGFLVAVKSLHGTASGSDRKELLEEAAVMSQFDHPNVVSPMTGLLHPFNLPVQCARCGWLELSPSASPYVSCFANAPCSSELTSDHCISGGS